MHILFLGTGAADYDLALTCSCRNCREMRALGGPNVRTYASALIGEHLLIDCGRTVPARLAECCIAPPAITDLLITHPHSDHLNVGSIAALAGVERPGNAALNIWANGPACEIICQDEAYESIGTRLLLHEIEAGDHFTAAGFAIIAFPAHHGEPSEHALNFVISDDEHSLLYATDTAWPLPEAWAALQGVHLDGAVLEATFGPLRPEQHPDLMTHHLNWAEAAHLHDALIAEGSLEADTPCFATHLSLHHCPIHEKCCQKVAQDGLQLAFDGCEAVL